MAIAAVAGIGACLALETKTIYQAIRQTLHTTSGMETAHGEAAAATSCATMHAGKLAVEAVDHCMRGESAPAWTHADDVELRFGIERTVACDRAEVIGRLRRQADGVVSAAERQRFLHAVQRLPQLAASELGELNIVADLVALTYAAPDGRGIF